MLNIPIVVAAYNRKVPLERLLRSLNKAAYSTDVKLIISIDGGADNREVIEVANCFEWRHGQKQVITHEDNMGLKNHILKCGKLTKAYDGIILLEDDLYVSPCFYSYVIQVHDAYRNDENIAGVALYSHQYNETACLPFKAIDDGNDVFFMKLACSWGQSWLTHQWEAFECWYYLNHSLDLRRDEDVPPDVRLWPDTSWKKYFLKYIISNHKYFVYPRISLATNFADPGVNHKGSDIFQVPLLYNDKEYMFPDFKQSIVKYDSYCEIIPETLVGIVKDLEGYEFEVDLYGMKNKRDISSEYIVTTQKLSRSIISFGRKLKPHELNICENISGNDIQFGLKKCMKNYGKFLKYRRELNQDYAITHSYFFPITEWHYKSTIQQEKISVQSRIYLKLRKLIIG